MYREAEQILEWSENETLNEELPMSKNHSRISYRLPVLLSKYEEQFEIMPEFDIELSSGKAKPDIAILEKGLTFDWWKDENWVKITPLSVIEILSPNQPLDVVVKKIADTFFAGGVKSAWLIVPSLNTVHILAPPRAVTTYTSGNFTDPATGITLKVEDIFK